MISVILPNFNHSRYLDHSLTALSRQTRQPKEVIIIDDASTDRSIEVIEPYLAKHKHVRLVRNPVNQGVIKTMNYGLAIAQTEILLFAGADDEIYPTFVEQGVALLEKYPHAAIFSARSDVIDAEGRKLAPLALPVPLDRPGYIDPVEVGRILMRDDSWFMGNTTLFRKAPLMEAGGFDEELGSFADGFVSCLVALRYGACYTPEILAAWRRIEGGFAWKQAVDIDLIKATITHATRRMRQVNSPFPPGYAKRWSARYLFYARHSNLRQKICSNPNGPVIWRWCRSLFADLAIAALFVFMRPWDGLSALRRHYRTMGMQR